jgi:xylulokinase
MSSYSQAPGPSADLLVAVDSSTTASKAVVFDARGQAVSTGRSPIAMANLGAGLHEQDPGQWWEATCAALRSALAGVDGSRVRSVTVTTQRETFVCLDRAGEPVWPAIVWMDMRARNLVSEIGSERVHSISGRPPDNTPSFYKLAWLHRFHPAEHERVVRVADVASYLNHRLTGRWASSWASADSLGMLDMQTKTWSAELAALAGLDPSVLPEVVPPGAVIGAIDRRVSDETGLPEGTAVVAGAGDGQCAAVGAGVLAPGALYLNMGTAVVTGAITPDYSYGRAYRTIAGADGDSYLLEAFLSSGTYLINWFRERLPVTRRAGQEGTPEELLSAAAAQIPPGAGGLLALPYWNAAQTPYWDPTARGAFVGMTGRHGIPHMYRAVLEGIALEIKLEVLGLCEAVASEPGEILVTGGGSRSDLWMQIVADVLDRPLTLCAEPETTALGAAMLGAVAAGTHRDLSAAKAEMCRYGRRIAPEREGSDRYAQLWEIYRTLYDRLKEPLTALSEFE